MKMFALGIIFISAVLIEVNKTVSAMCCEGKQYPGCEGKQYPGYVVWVNSIQDMLCGWTSAWTPSGHNHTESSLVSRCRKCFIPRTAACRGNWRRCLYYIALKLSLKMLVFLFFLSCVQICFSSMSVSFICRLYQIHFMSLVRTLSCVSVLCQVYEIYICLLYPS